MRIKLILQGLNKEMEDVGGKENCDRGKCTKSEAAQTRNQPTCRSMPNNAKGCYLEGCLSDNGQLDELLPKMVGDN